MLTLIIKRIGQLQTFLGALTSVLLICLVLLMTFNVIARYAFSVPTLGLEELSWHLYAAIFLLGIPYALKSDTHVRVDLLFEKMSPKTQAIIDLAGTLIFLIPSCLIICWAGWNFTLAAYQLGGQPGSVGEFFTQLVTSGIGEKSQDPGGLLNRWIIKGVIPLSFFFLLLSAIAFAAEKILTFQQNEKNDDPIKMKQKGGEA